MPSLVESGTEVTGDGKSLFHPNSETYPNYEEELSHVLELTDFGKEQIAYLAVHGHLEKSRFRSVIWQILLGILPYQSCLWVQKLRQLRSQFRSRRDFHLINPHLPSEDDHPLCQDDSSAWHQYFCDRDLQETIRKDVVRTSPGDTFFYSESIQKIMINILFVYAREHPKICYRQGMHEVLAPILLVLNADQQALLEAQKVMPVQGLILEVLDHTCLEEDAYCLLDTIMKHLACTYSTPDVIPSTGASRGPFEKPVERESDVLSRMRRICDENLGRWDPELRKHLVKYDIPLYFGIRWLRVMFNQEFSKANLLLLWDTIFAANENFGLVDCIVVAMLMIIRNRLLEEELTGCLDLLVHYPADNQIYRIIRLALSLLKPQVFPRPDFLDSEKAAMEAKSSTLSRRLRRLVTRPRKADSGYVSSPNLGSRSSSSRRSSFSPRGNRFEVDSNFHSSPRHPLVDTNREAAELLTSLQSKVFLTSLRLAKYQVTLEQHLSSTRAPTSVLNAVEGVKEISEMWAELGPPNFEVETATEATQSPNVSAPSSPESNMASAVLVPASTSVSNLASNAVSLNKPLKKLDLQVEMMEAPKCPRNKPTSESNFVLSNPLLNMNGLDPERDTQLHCAYQRLLGGGRIYACIKQ